MFGRGTKPSDLITLRKTKHPEGFRQKSENRCISGFIPIVVVHQSALPAVKKPFRTD